MRETHVSEWTPAAYRAREERRRLASWEQAQKDLQEIGLSDWTLAAFKAREDARRREDRTLSCAQSTIRESDWTLGAFQRRQAEGAKAQLSRLGPPSAQADEAPPLRTPEPARGAAANPLLTSEWTLPAFQAREAERAKADLARRSPPSPQPVDAPPRRIPAPAPAPARAAAAEEPLLASDWTLPAFHAREAERARREKSGSPVPPREPARPAPKVETLISQPVLESDWTLPAYRARQIDRAKREFRETPAIRENLARSGPLLASDWTLSAFQARERARARQEAREAAARAPVLNAALRPFLRAAATQAAARPGASAPRPQAFPGSLRPFMRAAVTPASPPSGAAPVSQAAAPAARAQPRQPPELTPVQGRVRFETTTGGAKSPTRLATDAGGPPPAPSISAPPKPPAPPPIPAAPRLDIAPDRGGSAAPQAAPKRRVTLRRLGYGLGAVMLLGLGVFLLRIPFLGKAPVAPAAKKAEQPAKRAPAVSSAAQKPSPAVPATANPTPPPAPPASKAPEPAGTSTAPPDKPPASSGAAQQPAAQQPPAQQPADSRAAPAPASTPQTVPPAASSAPAAAPASPQSPKPTAQPGGPGDTAKPRHGDAKPAPKPAKPKQHTEPKRSEGWFERLTNSLKRFGAGLGR